MKGFRYSVIVRFSIPLLISMAALANMHAKPANPAKKPAANKPATPKPADKPDKSKEIYYVGTIELPKSSRFTGRLSAKELIPLLGNIDPYTLKDRDADTLILYRTTKDGSSQDAAEKATLQSEVKELAPGHATAAVIRVQHGSSMDNMVKTITGLIPDKNITVTADGSDRIRVVRGPGVADSDYASFIEDIRRLGWQLKNESPVARVFYVNGSDVSAAVGGKGGSKGGGPDSSADKSGNGQTQSDTTTTTTINQVCLPQGGLAPTKGDPKATGDSGSQDDSKDSGSDDGDKSGQSGTPCAVAGADKAAKDDAKGGGDQGSPSVSVTSVNDDLLVFNAPQGHDADVAEKKRLLATLDLPRPEMLLNIWSFQASSSRGDEVARHARGLRRIINAFNEAIQGSIDNTWNDLQKEPDDSDLYKYLTQQYVGEYVADNTPGTASPATADSLKVSNPTNLWFCKADTYCLGYSSLFRPLKPTLTDMLLKIIVSDSPSTKMQNALQLMEGAAQVTAGAPEIETATCPRTAAFQIGYQAECQNAALACEEADRLEIAANAKELYKLAELDDQDDKVAKKFSEVQKSLRAGFPLHCFEAEAHLQFQVGLDEKRASARVRLLRAALANFLFHYKMSQQYPHEFSPYDLNQSAQELNSDLNPLIVAFNRDISTILDVFSQEQNKTESNNGWWGFGGHGSTFINNGVITVRTISGRSTTVDTITQSVFDATNPPSITDLINSVGKAESNVPGVLKSNLTANEAAAIIGALNSVTPAQSKVGREFKINITPRSLSGASASELQVSLDAKESAEPTLYSSGSSSSDNISRVADHNVDTKVRLESIKLFEISSFSAYLERSRRNFPILPPIFELPYIGSILSLPLPGAKEYHRSTAVISAIVVPTAIDIVSGIRFNFDRVVAPADPSTQGPKCEDGHGSQQSCTVRVALSMNDLSRFSISAYHRAKMACVATGAAHPFPDSNLDCHDLLLSKFYPER